LKTASAFSLGWLSRKITREYRDKIAEFNLTHSQFFMLMTERDFQLAAGKRGKKCM